MKVLAAADSFVPQDVFTAALAHLAERVAIRVITLDEQDTLVPSTPSERHIREYAGHPRQLVDALTDEEVLIVHGAPVTDAVLDASPRLRLVCCARGGPVNVDTIAATERGIPVVTSPGKNADAVADLALAFLIMLARGIPRAQRFLADGGQLGHSTFEGARFFGHDLGGHVLGLVGYGNVGRRVATRALAFGMAIRVYDPYVEASRIDAPGIVAVSDLEELVAMSDFVSLHARATAQNADFFGESLFACMKPGAHFINTAREGLVDESALHAALVSGHVAGAALDVVKATPGHPTPLLGLPTVIITPHIGGATYETATRGVAMLAVQIERYLAGQSLENVYNRSVGRGTGSLAGYRRGDGKLSRGAL